MMAKRAIFFPCCAPAGALPPPHFAHEGVGYHHQVTHVAPGDKLMLPGSTAADAEMDDVSKGDVFGASEWVKLDEGQQMRWMGMGQWE